MQFGILLSFIASLSNASESLQLESAGVFERLDEEQKSDTMIPEISNFYSHSNSGSMDSQSQFPRASFSSTTGLASSATINLRNDAKWVELENNGNAGMFLSVELKAALEAPALLDISDMDLAKNIFEVYDDKSPTPLGSTGRSKAVISSTGESEDLIRVKWSNGRIILPPGEHRLGVKVVQSMGRGKIGIRLSPAEVIDAPVRYRNGKAKLQKQSSARVEDSPPFSPITRSLRLFLIKSKLPANSIQRACNLFGGIPAVLQSIDLSLAQAVAYLRNSVDLKPDSRVFIDDCNDSKRHFPDSAFYLHFGTIQGAVGRLDLSAELDDLPMEYVLCQAVPQNQVLSFLSQHSSVSAKSAAARRQDGHSKSTLPRTIFGKRRQVPTRSDSSSTSNDSD